MLSFINADYDGIVEGSDSNTSHVIIYLRGDHPESKDAGFKYIPCYHLSCIFRHQRIQSIIQIHPMLSFIRDEFVAAGQKGNSNTSHVIIYPVNFISPDISPPFKYIPCYHLSRAFSPHPLVCIIQIHPMLSFIKYVRR